MQLLPLIDAMRRRQVVVSLYSHTLPNCGYTNIHEVGLSEGQTLARAHHHFGIVHDALPLPCLISGQKDGNGFIPEPLEKNMKLAKIPILTTNFPIQLICLCDAKKPHEGVM